MSRTWRRGRIYQGFKKVPDKDCHTAGNAETRLAGDRVVTTWETLAQGRWAKRQTAKQRRRAGGVVIRRAMEEEGGTP